MRTQLVDVDIDGVHLVKAPANRRKWALTKAEWDAATIDNLPDASFAHIGAGGTKDDSGKTVPRSLRHLPYKDAQGQVDVAHTRNALARLDQTDMPDAAKAAARAKLEAALRSAEGDSGSNTSKSVDSEETMKLTKAEFKTRIAKEVEGELDDAKLAALAKAIGIELTEKAEPDPKTEEPVQKADPETKRSMGKIVDAVDALAKQVEALTKENTSRKVAELTKRIAVLKRAGVEIEKDADEPVVEAAEKAMEAFFKRLDQVGITKAFGDPREADPAPTLVQAIHKEVRRILGREPIGKMEEIRAKKAVYDANPGLLSSVAREQRGGRAA